MNNFIARFDDGTFHSFVAEDFEDVKKDNTTMFIVDIETGKLLYRRPKVKKLSQEIYAAVNYFVLFANYSFDTFTGDEMMKHISEVEENLHFHNRGKIRQIFPTNRGLL